MSIHKRRWKTATGDTKEAWVADYMANGKRHIKTFSTQREAKAFMNKTAVAIAEGRHIADSDSLTVAGAAEIWLGAVTHGRKDHGPGEPSTLRQYRSHLKHHILPVLADKKLTQITKADVAAFRDHLLNKLSRPMAKKVLTSFKGILAEAETRGLVAFNIAASATIGGTKRGRHKTRIEIPSKADVRAILAKLDELATDKTWRRMRALISVAIYTGLRASEIRGLPWSAVDLKAGTLSVMQRADERGVIGPPKTDSSFRTINLPSVLVTMLRNWKIESYPGTLVFANKHGNAQSLSDIHERYWKPLQRAIGIRKADGSAKLNFHCLRHFRASQLIEAGANPKEVQEELGHSDIGTTFDQYGHLFTDDEADKHRKERAERLAKALA
jgi:integrase